MKYLFIIPLLIITLGTLRAQPSDTLEYALSFYPIQIGNEWEIFYDGSGDLPPDNQYTRIIVERDTLIHDHIYRVLHQQRWLEEPWNEPGKLIFIFERLTFERIDSSTGNVYTWVDRFDREVLIDSLAADIPGTEIQAFRYSWHEYDNYVDIGLYHGQTLLDAVQKNVLFDKEFDVRIYHQPGAIHISYQLASGLGLSGGLVYALIDGVEYGERVITSLNEQGEWPSAVRLHPNYPNPFNPSTTLRYDLDQAGPVRLEVFDLTGRRVALLADGHAPAGRHTAVFNAAGLASGFYIARLSAQGTVQHRKMLLVR